MVKAAIWILAEIDGFKRQPALIGARKTTVENEVLMRL
jgi:hypothetical protein